APSDFKRTDLNVVLNETIAELEMEIDKTNTRIEISDLPKLQVVPGLIRQLFFNLLSNAIKFRKTDEPPCIRIYSEKVEDEDSIPRHVNGSSNYHHIMVEDNGIGFDSKYTNEIFQVFKRPHSYHEYEGTGVGLSICKKIVEKHNGTITAKSEPGKGATFEIWLPEKQGKLSLTRLP